MKKINYPGVANDPFVTELQERVGDLFAGKSKKGGGLIWLASFGAIFMYFVPFFVHVGLDSHSIWITGVLGVLGALGYVNVGTCVAHDANHGTFNRSKVVNKVMSHSLELMGLSSKMWRVQHNQLHHVNTNIVEYDHDLYSASPAISHSEFGKKRRRYKWQYIFAYFLYPLTFFTWIMWGDLKRLVLYTRQGHLKKGDFWKDLVVLVVSKVLYLFVFLVLPVILGVPFINALIYWWIVIGLAALILMPVFQMAHVVEGVPQFRPEEVGYNFFRHQCVTSAEFTSRYKLGRWLLTWFLGGLNYQRVHHLFFAKISWVHYHKISGIVNELCKKHDVPIVTFPTVFDALTAHTRKLREVGLIMAMEDM